MASLDPEKASERTPGPLQSEAEAQIPLDALPKSRWERSWPVIACEAGLFSNGYLNGLCHTKSSPWEYAHHYCYNLTGLTTNSRRLLGPSIPC